MFKGNQTVKNNHPYFKSLAYSSETDWQLSQENIKALQFFKQRVEDGEYQFEPAKSICGILPRDPDAILLGCKDRYGLEVNTWISRKSGILWTSPRMDKSSLIKFYSEDYRSIYTSPKSTMQFYISQMQRGLNILKWIREKLNNEIKRDWVVFDIGCGSGGTLEPFRDMGCNVFGCDFGIEYLEYGRKHGLTLKMGTIDMLSEFGKADLIILSHVLEHSPDPIEFLKGLRHHLKDNGFIYITVPGVTNLKPYSMKFLRYLQNAHLYHFTQKTLTITASIAGLKLIGGDNGVQALFSKTKYIQPLKWDSLEYDHIIKFLTSHPRLKERAKEILQNFFGRLGFRVSSI